MSAFDEIFGYEKEKTTLKEISDMARNPQKYARMGARLPRGVLLHGEPGVGKTLMATSLAKETGRKTYLCRREGETEEFFAALSRVFSEAKASAPSVVILDDMDKFAMIDPSDPLRDYTEYVEVQSDIDSLEGADVLVIATANRLRDFPPSLLRPGRFDKIMEVRLPKISESRDIIGRYLKGKKVAADVDPEALAKILEGYSAAVLEGVLNTAAGYAGYAGRTEITMDDLVEACMRVAYDSWPYEDEEEPWEIDINDVEDDDEGSEECCADSPEAVALHEAGHAVAAALLRPGFAKFVALRKSRGSQGMLVTGTETGAEDGYFAELEVSLAGMAATEISSGAPDTGAESDVKYALRAAIKHVALDCADGYKYYRDEKDRWDPSYAQDDMVAERAIEELERAYFEVKELLKAHWDAVLKVSKRLTEKDVILGCEVEGIVSGAPGNGETRGLECKGVEAGL